MDLSNSCRVAFLNNCSGIGSNPVQGLADVALDAFLSFASRQHWSRSIQVSLDWKLDSTAGLVVSQVLWSRNSL